MTVFSFVSLFHDVLWCGVYTLRVNAVVAGYYGDALPRLLKLLHAVGDAVEVAATFYMC